MYILVADDDANIGKLIGLVLGDQGMQVECVYRGDDAVARVRENPPDLLILDVMMPGLDGFEVLRELRQENTKLPILMLTALSSIEDCVQGLELGADDYLIKPFKTPELIARVKALLRRVGGNEDAVSVGALRVSKTAYEVTFEGQPIAMPPRELELLYFLCKNPGHTFSREALLDKVWGYEFLGDSRTVDVHVKRLRERLGERAGAVLGTVWGIGYKCDPTALAKQE